MFGIGHEDTLLLQDRPTSEGQSYAFHNYYNIKDVMFGSAGRIEPQHEERYARIEKC